MHRFGTSGTVVVLCPLPARLPPMEMAGWLRRGQEAGVSVTWLAGLDAVTSLGDVCAAAGMPRQTPTVAIDVQPEWLATKTALRAALRQARLAWPGLAAAVLPAGTRLEHRDVLVQEGIGTVCVEGFDQTPRGNRRPAPRGWPCRSVLWGLWEVDTTARPRRGIIGGLTAWCGGSRAAHGDLTILQAGTTSDSGTAIRARFDKHLAWAKRRIQAGTLQSVGLADLPAVIAGGGIAAARGSVLRAA